MINKIHVNYIPSFYKRLESNSSDGDLAHPLYVFIQLFVLSQPLLNFAKFSSQEDLCIFCLTNLQFVLRCSHKCVHMTTRAYIDLHSVQLVAHFVCLGSILSVQCAHLCILCTLSIILVNLQILCFFAHFVTNLQQFVYQSNGSGYCVLLCQPEKKSGSIFGTWRRIINEVSSSNHLVFFITIIHYPCIL